MNTTLENATTKFNLIGSPFVAIRAISISFTAGYKNLFYYSRQPV